MKERVNKNIIIFILLFALVSVISIYSASLYTSKDLGNLAFKQCLWYLIGFLLVFLVIKVKNDFLYQNAWLLYWCGVFSLVLLLIFGTPINNSKCWFIIPGVGSVQPSEFMKIFIMLVLGVIISQFRSEKNNPSLYEEFIFIIKTFILVLIPAILTFLQPDTGAVIIYLVIYIFMMFSSGIRLRWFLIALGILVFILGICGGIYFFNEQLFVKIFGTSIYYRIERIFMWKDGIGLQLENAIASIGSAGILGYGIKKTPIYFPESSTDFIFAVFASNFGFLGTILFLILFVTFDIYIVSLFKKKINVINKFVLAGILGMLLFQQIQNIGMTVGLFPITGITLPFISYGGSSLLSYMIIVGILVNISSQKNKIYKYK